MRIIYEVEGVASVVIPVPNMLWTSEEKAAEAAAIAAREVEIAAALKARTDRWDAMVAAKTLEESVTAEAMLYPDVPEPIEPSNKYTIEELATKDVPEGVDFEIVPVSEIPIDRTFRNAWKRGNGRVDIDMPKARLIHMDRIRVLRNKKLDDLDTEDKIATDANDGQRRAEIAQERQTLRDIPQNFDLSVATTPGELKALIPTELA